MKANTENKKTACPCCIIRSAKCVSFVYIFSSVMFLVLAACVYSVFWNFLIIILCVLLLVSSGKCLLHGVMDRGTVTDSPHTGLVLIISSKILPTAARGMAGHAAISSCAERAKWGQSGRWSISWGPFPLQLYGFPTIAGHKLVSVMLRSESTLKLLSERESKHRHPCSALS